MVVYCAVKGCRKNSRHNGEHTFFRLPQNPKLREKWSEFAGISNSTKKVYICIDHFEPKYIWKRNPRCLLVKDSIPTLKPGNTATSKSNYSDKDKDAVVEPSADTFMKDDEIRPSTENNASGTTVTEHAHEVPRESNASPFRTQEDAVPGTSSDSHLQTKITPKTLRINTQRRTISALRSKIYRLRHQSVPIRKQKRKSFQHKVDALVEDMTPFLSKEAKILFEAQLRLAGLNKFGKRYSDHIKDIALSIFYHSRKTYKYLKKFLNLPSERTLRKYQSRFPVNPGLNLTVLNALQSKFKDAPESDRLVSLLVDEISLVPEVHFDSNSDKFTGYADDGTERQPNVAKSAVVAMLTWINKNVKQVIGYYFLGSKDNSCKVHQLILQSLDKCHEHGLIVKNVVFDQGPRNQSFLSTVGVTPEKPYFHRNGVKTFVSFDTPHLLKSLRNNLLEKNLIYKKGIVDWAEIRQVFDMSRTNPLNLLPKISKQHFVLNNHSKMRVKLAAQIFSESMYTAHLVYKTIFPEKFSADNTTSQFLLDMDKLFDSLNSTLLHKTLPQKLNYAISIESGHIEFLKSMLETFKEARFVGPRAACIKGVQLTINAVLQLFDDLSTNYGIKQLCTRRLNQDPLENFFAIVRQQHGCSNYPSPMQFQSGVRHVLIAHLTKISNSSNCEADHEHIFAKLSSIKDIPLDETVPKDLDAKVDIAHNDFVNCVPESEIQEFTEMNAVYYICGYLSKKFLSHHNCMECETILITENDYHYADHKLFTIMKTYAETNGLKYVTEHVFRTILAWEQIYKGVIKSIVHSNNITKVITQIIEESCVPLELCTPEMSKMFLKTYLQIRNHWEARFIRRELCEAKTGITSKKNKKFVGKTI